VLFYTGNIDSNGQSMLPEFGRRASAISLKAKVVGGAMAH
jgi:hypothetical protein